MHALVARPVVWFFRWLGVQTALSLGLLLVALGSVALGLADLIRGLDSGLLLPLTIFGMSLGWMLAKSPLPGWLAGVLGLALGVEALVVRVGRLSEPLTKLLGSPIEFVWQFPRWPLDGPPAVATAKPALLELQTGLSSLLTRVSDWALAVLRGEAAFDPLAATLVWGLILWLTSVWAGWAARRRHQPLHSVTPAGILLAVGLSYTWDHPYPLWIMLGATLLLTALMGHTARERRWQATGIDFSPELRFDLALTAIGLSLALLTAAIIAPSISVRPIVRFAHRLLVERLSEGKQVADSMGLEPLAGSGIPLDQVRAAGLPNRSLIGSGPELSEQVVMVIYLEGLESFGRVPASPSDATPSFYWRALTYDEYTGRGWQTGVSETMAYRAGEPADRSEAVLNSSVHRILRQQVQVVGDRDGLLYRAGELVTADHDFRVAWRAPGDAFGAQIDAQAYLADSLLPVVSEAQLRTAENDYPEWALDRYLTLPPDVPTRVRALAHDLTAGEPTAYDQARAIESYLRTFTYNLDVPAPPPNRDVADYFLFDLKQGYCDYYASTMVVLARAAGLPARLVVGYINGVFYEEEARYVVTAADAHSWVEIYFPSYGWIEFEPTGGRPAIERPAEVAVPEIPEPQTPLEPRVRRRLQPGQLLWLVPLGSLVLVALGALAWWVGDGWRLQRLPPLEAVTTLYGRLHRHGRRLEVPTQAGDTPYEFEAGLTQRLSTLAQDRRSRETTLTTQKVRWLTDLYVRGLYSPRKVAVADRQQALKTWRQLRRKLWLAWIWHRTSRRKTPRL